MILTIFGVYSIILYVDSDHVDSIHVDFVLKFLHYWKFVMLFVHPTTSEYLHYLLNKPPRELRMKSVGSCLGMYYYIIHRLTDRNICWKMEPIYIVTPIYALIWGKACSWRGLCWFRKMYINESFNAFHEIFNDKIFSIRYLVYKISNYKYN